MEQQTDGQRLGYAIHDLRQLRQEGLAALARRAGISPGGLSMLEAGLTAQPGHRTATALATALGFSSADELLRVIYGREGLGRRRARGLRQRPRCGSDAGRGDGNGPAGEAPEHPG